MITAEPIRNASITKFGIHFVRDEPRYVSEGLAKKLASDGRFKIDFDAMPPLDEETVVAEVPIDTGISAEPSRIATIVEIIGALDVDKDYDEAGKPLLLAVQTALGDYSVVQAELDAALKPAVAVTATATPAEAKKMPTIKRAPKADAPADDAHEV